MVGSAEVDERRALAVEALFENGCAGEAHAPEDDSATVTKGSVELFQALPFDVGMPAETANSAQAAPDVFEAHEDVLFGDGARIESGACRQSLADLSFEVPSGLTEEQLIDAKEDASGAGRSARRNDLSKQSPAR